MRRLKTGVFEDRTFTDGQRKKKDNQKSESPWRKSAPFDGQLSSELADTIGSFKPRPDHGVTEARVLMLGPVGSGKSSFFNTINSVFSGRITQRACSGTAGSSITRMYIPYSVQDRSGATLNFRMCDTRGLEETSGLTDAECNFLLDGHFQEYYQLGTMPVSIKSSGFKLNPAPNDQVHCVVFVLDSTTLEELTPKLLEKMKGFQDVMNFKGIPQLIVLTKIDKLSVAVKEDVSSVFKDHEVEQSVEKASKLLGLPRTNVLPVKNYESEIDVDENINTLALLSLRQILNFAQDYLVNLHERNKDICSDVGKLEVF